MLEPTKILGVWREYAGKRTNPSLWDEKFEEHDILYKDQILQYLEQGVFVIGTRGVADCLLAKDGVTKISPKTCLTDGEYVWTTSFMRYVKDYGLVPSEAFIQYLIGKNFVFPSNIDKDIIEKIEVELYHNYLI